MVMVKKLIESILDDFFIYVQHHFWSSKFPLPVPSEVGQMPELGTGGATPRNKDETP